MPRIAVCDDNPVDLCHLKALIARELGAMDEPDSTPSVSAIDGFPSGEALLAQVEAGVSYTACFVDVMMERLSGIETARRLNQLCGGGFDLVFTTNSADFALDAFNVSAVDYLIKPIDETKLRRALARCRRMTVLPECITILKNKRNYRLVKREITFIESFAHLCVFHVGERELSTYMTMDAVTRLVNDSAFVRCHKSYIVNLEHVKNIGGEYLQMQDGGMIPVGRAMRKQMQSLYDQFLIRKVWEKRHND